MMKARVVKLLLLMVFKSLRDYDNDVINNDFDRHHHCFEYFPTRRR